MTHKDELVSNLLKKLEDDYEQLKRDLAADGKTEDKFLVDKYAAAYNALEQYAWYKLRPKLLPRESFGDDANEGKKKYSGWKR